MLLQQVVPLIAAAIARGAVRPVGTEDHEELKAEGCAIAAAMLDSAEGRRKPVEARHVAFYAVQALKSGRRACYAGRADAMSPAAQLDGNAVLASLDAPYAVASDDADVAESTLHDSLAAGFEDGATLAGRRLDWDLVLRHLDDRRRHVLVATAEGRATSDIAKSCRVSAPRICQVRESIGSYIYDAWGSNGIAESAGVPCWQSGLRAAGERREARYLRSR